MIYEYAAHGLRCHGVEVGPVLPTHSFMIDQSKIGLIDQGRGLERVAESLAAHVIASQPSHFFVNQRNQLVERSPIPLAPLDEELSN